MKAVRMIALLCLLLAVCCGAKGVYDYIEEKNAGKEYEKLREQVVISKPEKETTPEAEKKPQPSGEPEPTREPVVIPIDFEALKEKNADAYAWLRVPGTTIDYPILQSSKGNGYYLNRTIEHVKKRQGAIFTEDYNSKTFEDPNTVIYGHNMSNGSMFRSLHKYRDRSFFDENREIYIYLPDKILHYEIFAAYRYDKRHLLLSCDFDDKEEYGEYLDDIFSMRDMSAFIDKSMEVTNEDKIITLSTCFTGARQDRYLVQAVLVSIEE